MDRIVNAIIGKLETSSIWNGIKGQGSNIILFSDNDVLPEPPYIAVKPETGAMPNTRQFRIIAHMRQGEFDKLEDFTLTELDGLLLGGIEDKEGSRYKLQANGYTDIMPDVDDNTYFMERMYYAPLRKMGG